MTKAELRGQVENKVELHWNIIAQDGPYPWSPEGQRVTDLAYMRQLAGAAEQAGFDGALIATLAGATDPWGLAAALTPVTSHLKFIVAQYAGVIEPLWLAQMAATLDLYSQGRVVINIITGADHGAKALGNFLSKDARYAQGDEYWAVFSRLMTGETVDFDGEHVRLQGARLLLQPRQPKIELMFGGSSPAGLRMAARRCDTWLTLGIPPQDAARRFAEVRSLAAAEGRKLRCGVRLHVIVRETAQAAWAQAQWLYDRMDRETIARHLARVAPDVDAPSGQAEMTRLVLRDGGLPADARALEVSADLWAGIGLVRIGPGTAIVGDPQTVAARLKEYEAAGADVFILSGYPHIEEAYRFGDLVMPLLRGRQDPIQRTWL